MFKLKSVLIDGLWGNDGSISFNLDENFNFIIGKNGCGKTTVINLLAAVLVCDYERLDKIPFKRVVLSLFSIDSKKHPSVEVAKTGDSGIPFLDIRYSIKESKSSKPIVFGADQLMEKGVALHVPTRFLRERYLKDVSAGAREVLEQFAKVNWLSVHRKSDEEQSRDERRNIPAVDQKLSSLSNNLVKYFSGMSKQYEDKTKDFQKKSFFSLITYERDTQIAEFVKNVDLDSEKDGLSGVFSLLRIESKEYSSKLQQSYERFAEARELFVNKKTMDLGQFFSIFNALKSHSLVKYYEALQSTSYDIFRPRQEFVSVLNELFEGRKIVSISARNELCVKARHGDDIRLEELSSGEKQLIIILGEALLQEGAPVIYIADEPELSLHVTWQEQLTGAIARLNPNAQIIFATHSPDIVGIHQDKVLDMEKVVA